MRIRKHAKLAGLSLTATSPSGFSADLTPHGSSYRFHCPHHICQLNQSPWDVLSFPPDSPSSPFQVDGEESNYTANGSSANSLGAVESVASMRISMDMEDKNVNHNKNGIGLGFGNGGTISCCKTVGKGLKCKMEAWKGHSLCQHHLPHQLTVYDSLSAHPSAAAKKLEKPVTGPIRRRRGRPRKVQVPPPPPPTVVNPYEFYYYSGFGPRWGRKRGVSHIAKAERVEEEEKEINVRERVLHSSILVSSSEMDSDEFDYVEDKKKEDEENNANAKKKKMRRGRKPIKARSLKSLM
ncbi:hypothetical protein RHSIM_Rhsim01G0164000 [Rhododendron simsii]|uniref:WRC domain-containing protein n=1 Tax=Rhododendron simsii TaxID=118357 RepID=A0A834HTP9_RHOSS|nr:hypothetical protein RHSIM_Rhsim01G0164000 [Rhododendron simsii]